MINASERPGIAQPNLPELRHFAGTDDQSAVQLLQIVNILNRFSNAEPGHPATAVHGQPARLSVDTDVTDTDKQVWQGINHRNSPYSVASLLKAFRLTVQFMAADNY